MNVLLEIIIREDLHLFIHIYIYIYIYIHTRIHAHTPYTHKHIFRGVVLIFVLSWFSLSLSLSTCTHEYIHLFFQGQWVAFMCVRTHLTLYINVFQICLWVYMFEYSQAQFDFGLNLWNFFLFGIRVVFSLAYWNYFEESLLLQSLNCLDT